MIEAPGGEALSLLGEVALPPGHPSELEAAARSCAGAGAELDHLSVLLRGQGGTPQWSGTAAAAYRGELAVLAASYAGAASVLCRGAGVLASYGRDVAAAQELARLAQVGVEEANATAVEAAGAEATASSANATAALAAEEAGRRAALAALPHASPAAMLAVATARARAAQAADDASQATRWAQGLSATLESRRARALALASQADEMATRAAGSAANAFASLAAEATQGHSRMAGPWPSAALGQAIGAAATSTLVPLASLGWQANGRPGSPWWAAGRAGPSLVGWMEGHVLAPPGPGAAQGWQAVVQLATADPAGLVRILGDSAGMVLGVLGVAAGGTMDGIGVAMDATGVGAVAGIPLDVAGTALVVASTGLVAVEAVHLGADLNSYAKKANKDQPQKRPPRAKGQYVPTSKTFGQPQEVVYKGSKEWLRVDAEADANSVHFQIGKGMGSELKRTISIEDAESSTFPRKVVKLLTPAQLEKVGGYVKEAARWIRSMNVATPVTRG